MEGLNFFKEAFELIKLFKHHSEYNQLLSYNLGGQMVCYFQLGEMENAKLISTKCYQLNHELYQ